MYILDTNTVSELRKVALYRADKTVIKWFEQVNFQHLYLSSITLMELEIGILRIERKDAVQANKLRLWVNTYVLPEFSERTLVIDTAVALNCARFACA